MATKSVIIRKGSSVTIQPRAIEKLIGRICKIPRSPGKEHLADYWTEVSVIAWLRALGLEVPGSDKGAFRIEKERFEKLFKEMPI